MKKWLFGFGILATALATAITMTVAKFDMSGNGQANEDAKQLYAELVQASLLGLKDGEIRLPDPDGPLLVSQAVLRGEAAKPMSATEQALLERLYSRTDRAGLAVREAVILFNKSRALVAVRDQRYGGPAAGTGVILQEGDRPAEWLALDRYGRSFSVMPLALPERYGYMGRPEPGMGDWLVVDGGQPVRLVTRLPGQGNSGRDLVIQAVGKLDLSASRLPKGYQLASSCRATPCGSAGAEAHLIRFPAGTWEGRQVELALAPVRAQGVQVGGRALCPNRDPAALPHWCANKVRHYPTMDAGDGRQQAPRPPPLTILTRDKVVLWAEGRPTPAAVELGLLPVLGVDPRHGWSLVALLGRGLEKDQPRVVTLTIDSRYQRAALDALYTMVRSRFEGREDDAPFAAERVAALVLTDPETGGILATAQWPAAPQGVNTYDVAASLANEPLEGSPHVPLTWFPHKDLLLGSAAKTILDLAVLEAATTRPDIAAAVKGCRPNADGSLPCLPGLNIHQTRYRPEGMSCSQEERQRGQCGVANFLSPRGWETFAKDLSKPRRASSCVADARPDSIVDMPYGIMTSSNILHVLYMMMMDGKAALDYDQEAKKRPNRAPPGQKPFASPDDLPDRVDSRFVAMAARLGLFSDGLSLAPPFGDTASTVWRQDISHAARSELYEMTRPETKGSRLTGAVDVLVQTSIGARISATPLQMALVMAAIQTGGVRQAHIVQAVNGTLYTPPPAKPLGVDTAPLVQGLKQAVEAGTSAGAFSGDAWKVSDADGAAWLRNNARCGIFAKTGTAEFSEQRPCPDPQDKTGRCPAGVVREGKPAYNTGWLVGYNEPLPALAADKAGVGRIAFACAITKIHGRDTKTGGATCAPAVADLYRQLSRIEGENPSRNSLVQGDPGLDY